MGDCLRKTGHHVARRASKVRRRTTPPAAVPAPLRLRYLYGALVAYHAGQSLDHRVITDYEFVLIIEGQVRYRCNGRDHDLPPGAVVLSQPGFAEQYTWDAHGPTRHAYIHFQIDQLPGDWPPPRRWPVTQTQPDPVVPALLRHIVNRAHLHADWPTRPPSHDDCRIVEALLSAYLKRLPQIVGRREQSRPEPVRRCITFMRQTIDEHPDRTMTLVDLADAAGVSPKHLCKLFDRALGHAPMQTYNLLRMQLALSLLGWSNLTVKQIADRCGYGSAFYFSRYFTATYGQSPRAVRARALAGKPLPRSPLPPDVTPRLHW
jgi:AraC-like DNA-binding protein/quercetin dioxygenase-like cupin family protein